jgi:hypothetical protein
LGLEGESLGVRFNSKLPSMDGDASVELLGVRFNSKLPSMDGDASFMVEDMEADSEVVLGGGARAINSFTV